MNARHILVAGFVLGATTLASAQEAGAPGPSLPGPSQPGPSQPLRATGGAYPARQDTSQWLGSNLIGAKVVSAANETIGRITNLVINDEGAIESVVIAVGGLLGVGAREVAVTYRSLAIIRTKAGDAIDHVTLAATRSDMRQAAEFKTLTQQMAERSVTR
jgi:hypothetical protein